jgi:hypothetical protein
VKQAGAAVGATCGLPHARQARSPIDNPSLRVLARMYV